MNGTCGSRNGYQKTAISLAVGAVVGCGSEPAKATARGHHLHATMTLGNRNLSKSWAVSRQKQTPKGRLYSAAMAGSNLTSENCCPP